MLKKDLLKKLKIPKRNYLRPLPPTRTEKRLGYFILVLVGVIGVSIYLAGKRYDANLFRLDPRLLNKKSEPEPPIKVIGGERREVRQAEPVGKIENPPSKPEPGPSGVTGFFSNSAGGGDWSQKGPIQSFTSENLYDKVDGRENLYKSYEFHQLLAVDYVSKTNPNRFIQVELFDLTSSQSALGVFSAERPQHMVPAKIGQDAYTDTNGAFFRKGQYYVRVIGSDDQTGTQQAAIKIALDIASKIVAKKEAPLADPLPTENRIPNSATYIAESAFGQSFFKNVNSARFRAGKIELTGFVMKTSGPPEASSVIEQFRKAMSSFGNLEPIPATGYSIHHIEVAGSHYVVFEKGSYVGGVMEADEKEPAIELARKIADHLSQ